MNNTGQRGTLPTTPALTLKMGRGRESFERRDMNRFETFEDVDLAIDKHHEHPALGSSRLRGYIEDVKPPGDKARAAMDIGTATHLFALEPDNADFVKVRPKFSGTGSVRARSDWNEEHHGFLILTQHAYDTARFMADSLLGSRMFRRAVEHPASQIERTVLATTDTGIVCKARPDVRIPSVLQLDVKSTHSTDDATFARAFSDRGYDLQSALYSDIDRDRYGKPIPYWIAAVRSYPPYRVSLEQVSDEWMDVGRKLYESAIWHAEHERDHNERAPLHWEGDHYLLPPPPWVSMRAERIREHAQRLGNE